MPVPVPERVPDESVRRLRRYSDDVAVLRRHLVDAGLLERFPDGTGYRRVRADPAGRPDSIG